MRVALCQINPIVGDIKGNSKIILSGIANAKASGADVVVFPELALTGYPPEDLLLKKDFVDANISALKKIASECDGITAIVGYVNNKSGKLYNSAAVIQNKKLISSYDKICLPNYGVFDEKRYFTPGKNICKFKIKEASIGVVICEDIWRNDGPAHKLSKSGTDLIIAINASPFFAGKWKERENIAKTFTKNGKTSFAYLNLVGGQDELVFDGGSFVISNKGNTIVRGKQFEEDILTFDMPASKPITPCPSPLTLESEIYAALCLGLKDYVRKNGFKKVILGLSGGIDSALVATIAADALGKENVKTLFMPSQYTSDQSKDDAFALAKNLGIDCTELAISNIFPLMLGELHPFFRSQKPNIAEENLQARIRGNLLMAFSNKFGYLVLATGNKSEVSTGYATLYGDMCGGLSVIKDVPKTLVYKLSNYRNTILKVIPKSIIDRALTAELKPNQKDQDTLPPYEVLDKIIEAYVENDMSKEDIITAIHESPDLIDKTIRMIDKNEYKRRQSAPGIKITPKAFGRDRRMPITNGY